MLRKLLIIQALLFHFGCSVQVKVYIRNTLDREVRIQYFTNNDFETPLLKYRSDFSTLDYESDIKMNDTLPVYKSQVQNEYNFILPAKSTVYLGRSLNYQLPNFSKLTIERIDTLDEAQLYKFSKKSNSISSKNLMWYDIK
jgi:hypothetical protein